MKTKRLILLIGGLNLALYAYLYQYEPIEGFWLDVLLDISFPLWALTATFFLYRVSQAYEAHEKPRRIWLAFAAGLGAWTLAEIIWMYLDVFPYAESEVPPLSLADIPWLIGYACFALAFWLQYVRLKRGDIKALQQRFIQGMVFTIAATAILTLLLRQSGAELPVWQLAVLAFYPVADLVLGIGAIRLWRSFGRGRWIYPWFGLLIFVAGDIPFTLLGAFEKLQEEPWLLLADLIYLFSYIMITYFCYHLYALFYQEDPLP
nr:hypothetical protein [Ardenticatena sp.]